MDSKARNFAIKAFWKLLDQSQYLNIDRHQRFVLYQTLKRTSLLWRYPASRFRMKPSFILIGAQKSGTSTLFDMLIQNDNIARPLLKEIWYFDRNFRRSENWYRAHFPLTKSTTSQTISGEASPEYMCYPHAASRISAYNPDMKIIALCRNPVTRAFSHYRHSLALGVEPLAFEDALKNEEDRLSGEMDKMQDNPFYFSTTYSHWAYQHKGLYRLHLEPWFRHFRREQILLVQSETFFRDPLHVYRQVCHFLNVESDTPVVCHQLGTNEHYKNRTHISEQTKTQLAHYYSTANEEFYELAQITTPWWSSSRG